MARYGLNPLERVAESPAGDDGVPPRTPTGIAATGGDAKVRVSWTNPTDSDLAHIYIYRAVGAGAFELHLVTQTELVPGEAYGITDTNVVNDTTYSYYVTAVDTGGLESDPSATVSATPTAAPAFALPASFFVEFKLDEGTGSVATDNIGTRNYDFAAGAAAPTWAAHGLVFNGPDFDYLTQGVFTEVTATGAWTMAAIIRTSDVTATAQPDRAVFSQTRATGDRCQVMFRNGRINIGNNNGTTITAQAANWADNTWMALGCSQDGVGNFRIWQDQDIRTLVTGAIFIGSTVHNRVGLNDAGDKPMHGDLAWIGLSTAYTTDLSWRDEIYPYLHDLAAGKGITLPAPV